MKDIILTPEIFESGETFNLIKAKVQFSEKFFNIKFLQSKNIIKGKGQIGMFPVAG